MLADCCMLLCQKWGLMAAVGRQRPQWWIDARNHIKQKTSPPAPISPAVPTPLPRIMPPWCSNSADAKKQPIWHGGCQDNGLEAGCHGWGVRVCLLIYLAKTRSQQHNNTCRHIMTKLAGSGRHGAPLPLLPHTTVNQHVGWLLHVAALEVRHHGGCGTVVAAMVNGARFS